jgi:protein TonB
MESLDVDAGAAEPRPDTPEADGHGTPGGAYAGTNGGVIGGVIGGVGGPPAPLEPVRVGGAIQEPAKVKHVAPAYPDIAVRSNVQGAVVLDCTISPQGRVAAVTVVRGIPLLNEAAVAAVRQWVYTPTLRDGVPVPIIMTVTVRFGLEERRRS